MEKIMNFSDRIRQIIDHYDLTVNELAAKIGGSRMKFYNLTKGLSKPDFKTTESILNEFPDVSAEWLMRGDGAMLKKDLLSAEEAEVIREKLRTIKSLYREELLGKRKGATLFSPDRSRTATAIADVRKAHEPKRKVAQKPNPGRTQGVLDSRYGTLN